MSWEKGYEILKKANEESQKYRDQVAQIMKNETLSKKDYNKIKELLEKEATIRKKAFEKIEKIHRDKTENFSQQWEG